MPGRKYSGQFSPTYARVPEAAFKLRAYGHGPLDPRRVCVDTLGVETCDMPDCDMGGMEDGGPADIPLDKLAIVNKVLRRGRLSSAEAALKNGVKNDVENPITVMARMDDPEKYVVVPGHGEHRVAHLKLSGHKGNVPVRMMKPKLGKSGTSDGAEKAWEVRHANGEGEKSKWGKADGSGIDWQSVSQAVAASRIKIEASGDKEAKAAYRAFRAKRLNMGDPRAIAEVEKLVAVAGKLTKSGTSEGADKAWVARHAAGEGKENDRIGKIAHTGRIHEAGVLLDQAVDEEGGVGQMSAFKLGGIADAAALNAGNLAFDLKESDKELSDKWYEAKSRWSGLAEAVKKKDWEAAETRLEEVTKVVLG